MRYRVNYTNGVCIIVDTAAAEVLGMSDKEFLLLANASLEIQSVEEVT